MLIVSIKNVCYIIPVSITFSEGQGKHVMNNQMGNSFRSYDVVEGWAKLPEHLQFGYTHGIVVDQHDNVYVFHTGKPSIYKFDKSGAFIAAWGGEFEGGAHGFYLHQDKEGAEYLYVTDTAKGIAVKMDMNGRHLLTLGTPERADLYDAEKIFVPTDIAVAPNGDIYVTDGYGQSWIHQYTAQGEYIHSWGGKGSAEGQLNCPHGISIDLRSGETEVYVADRGNHRIQVFTLNGQYQRTIVDDMDMPCSFYFYQDEVYFPDLNSRVTILDRSDRLICHLGEDQQAYKQKGWPNLPESYYRANKFSSPHGVCVDSEGSVYMAEWIQTGRVTKLARIQ
jgi:DNA-binding beta-propeller fold protein YncE